MNTSPANGGNQWPRDQPLRRPRTDASTPSGPRPHGYWSEQRLVRRDTPKRQRSLDRGSSREDDIVREDWKRARLETIEVGDARPPYQNGYSAPPRQESGQLSDKIRALEASLLEEKRARAEEADRVSRMKAVLQDLLSQLVDAKYELFTNGSYMEDVSVRCS